MPLTCAVAVQCPVSVRINLHPIIADQPDEVLGGQGFIQPKLTFEQFDFCRVDVTALSLTCERSTRRKIDKRKEQDAE